MTVNTANLVAKLRGLKVGIRHGEPVPKVRPKLLPEERDAIVFALEQVDNRSTLARGNDIEAEFYRLKAMEWACEPEEALECIKQALANVSVKFRGRREL